MKTCGIQARVADVQVGATLSASPEAGKMPKGTTRELPAKGAGRPFEQVEELLRCLAAQDAAKAIMLDDRLGLPAEMPQIGEAHAVDPRGQSAVPATPDEPRYVEQDWSVVGH
jgi:hypothetical protein